MAALGTWSFSLRAVKELRARLERGEAASACLEAAMAVEEVDPDTGPYLVGYGGYPCAAGMVQCDAAIMEGGAGRFGAVAALEGVRTPLGVARRVMEQSAHSFLAGEGAQEFARKSGFTVYSSADMLTEHAQTKYQEFLKGGQQRERGHDTLGLIVLDLKGDIAVGVSTSGVPFKLPGRVGDSPLPGSGLYADEKAGAAAASGDGDDSLCFCPCFHVVQCMKQGLSPQEACDRVMDDIYQRVGLGRMFSISLIALSVTGEFGAASTERTWRDVVLGEEFPGFPFSVWRRGMEEAELHVRLPHGHASTHQ